MTLSLDLRPFDCGQADFGVTRFFDHLGFRPTRILFHSSGLDRVHDFDGRIDNTLLLPMHVAQRGIPGGQFWTRRHYKLLCERLQSDGVAVYQGTIPILSDWKPYPGRVQWLYDHRPELFTVSAQGQSGIARGTVNPLRRLRDGRPYAELLAHDAARFIRAFELDGYFAADGLVGLYLPLDQIDFAPDRLEAFARFLGLRGAVPGEDTAAQATWILRHERYAWSAFHARDWADFHRALTAPFAAMGRDVVGFSPMRQGPGKAFFDRGIDYGLLYAAGLHTVYFEVFETLGRAVPMADQWTAAGALEMALIKAQAPDMAVGWTAAFANIPEHWNSPLDVPNLIERELLAVPTTTVTVPGGARVPAADSVHTIWGNDLTSAQWRWMTARLATSGAWRVKRPLGPALLWSDAIMHAHSRAGGPWTLCEVAARLRFSGISIHDVLSFEALPDADPAALLLVDPLGITDDEVAGLERALDRGIPLVIAGECEHVGLLGMLGLLRQPSGSLSPIWRVTETGAEVIGPSVPLTAPTGELAPELYPNFAYALNPAEPARALIVAGKSVLASWNVRPGHAPAAWIRPATRGLPTLSTAGFPGAGATAARLNSLAQLFPDALAEVFAQIVRAACPEHPRVNVGQLLAFREAGGEDILLCENAANPFYTNMWVGLCRPRAFAYEDPLRHLGSVGYLEYSDASPAHFVVKVPPDATIAVHVRYHTDPSGSSSPPSS